MQVTLVSAGYLEKLEHAILEAEWWLADVQVAARKDPRSERKRNVSSAADSVRERKREIAA